MSESSLIKAADRINYLQSEIDSLDNENANLRDTIEVLESELREHEVKNDILYGLARLTRNTDGLHPSTQGPAIGKLLLELRLLNGSEYALKVM